MATASAQSSSSVDRASSAIEEGPGFKPRLGHHFSEISLHLGVHNMWTHSCMDMEYSSVRKLAKRALAHVVTNLQLDGVDGA